jgi:hypothetical protein
MLLGEVSGREASARAVAQADTDRDLERILQDALRVLRTRHMR